VSIDVLEPVVRPRRRRRRYRLRRLIPVAVVVLLAFAGGFYVGARGSGPTAQASASGPQAEAAPAAAAAKPATASTPKTKPLPPVARLLHGPPALAGRLSAPIAAASAIVVDADTGQVLWTKNAHTRRPIASTTKIMTALLAMRVLKPKTLVRVDPSVTRVPLVREGLRANEIVPSWKLFDAMLLYSGNDDALALAIAAGGTRRAFLKEMNAEAKRLHLRDTHFTSPSGVIDKGNYSTAYDLAALARYALRNPRFAKIVRTKVVHVKWAAPTYSKIYINNNSLLKTYPGANGVKTGFTHKAGWCLVSSATRHGRTLIAVVLNSGDMYKDSKKLLDLGFRNPA